LQLEEVVELLQQEEMEQERHQHRLVELVEQD
jgi:hypothetical protein